MQDPSFQFQSASHYQPHTIQSASDTPQPQTPAVRIGDLLVQQGVLTAAQVAHVLDVQSVVHRPFGELAERLFDVPAVAVDAAWAQQLVALHGARDVSLEEPEPGCVAMLNSRQAWQFRLVPLRRELSTPGHLGHLLLATDPARLRRAINFAARSLPLAPTFVLATRTSLQTLLTRTYPVSPAFQRWAAET